jgi:hypothetical protein
MALESTKKEAECHKCHKCQNNMTEYRFSLQKYEGVETRYTCPSCNKPRRFTRYVDNENENPVAVHVGRCERIDSCGYHYTPKEYFKDNDIRIYKPPGPRKILRQKSHIYETSQIDHSDVKSCIYGLEQSSLVKYLYLKFGKPKVAKVLSNYLIGHYFIWNESCPVFWQIDIEGKVRTGKVIKYNAETGKRIKKPRSYIYWMHKVLNYNSYNLVQCLYGEHLLLKYPKKTVGVVESEKTALIASIYFDDILWLATGGKSNMNFDKFKVLSNRKVCLYPDLNSFSEWSLKADEMSSLIPKISVSDVLERKATQGDKSEGYDLADYIIKSTQK